MVEAEEEEKEGKGRKKKKKRGFLGLRDRWEKGKKEGRRRKVENRKKYFIIITFITVNYFENTCQGKESPYDKKKIWNEVDDDADHGGEK